MNNSLETKTEDFFRYEFKYLLNLEKRKSVESEISNFMSYDSHINKDLKNSYYVRSLYFDNNENENYYEKIDGIRLRKKFRIRTYGRSFEEGLPIFLEEKGRYIDRTFKHRVRISAKNLPLFYVSGREQDICNLYPDVEVVQRFVFEVISSRIKPKVLVDYIRRPYTSTYDVNFRVTIDSHIKAANTNSLFPDQTTNWICCKAGYSIMEVKFHRRIPAWFHRIIQAYEITRLSISKFCEGMEETGLAIDLS